MAVAFRFDPEPHEYIDLATGALIPHITGLLEAAGLIDDLWYTEEGNQRGTYVHRLTASYDLGAVDLASCVAGAWRPYLLAHAAAMGVLRPTWASIEVPMVHPVYRFGGRPDRIGKVFKLATVLEVKTGGVERSHQIQTALQAILAEGQGGLPAEHYQRLALYLKGSGKYKLERHNSRGDFDEAYRIIRDHVRRAA